MVEVKGKFWGDFKKLNLKGNDSIFVGYLCVFEDGKFLIFVFDMIGFGY